MLLELFNEVIFLSRFLILLFRRLQTCYGIDIQSQSSSSIRALDEKMPVIIGMLTFEGVAVGSTQDLRRTRESERQSGLCVQDGVLIVTADCRSQGREVHILSVSHIFSFDQGLSMKLRLA